MAVVGVFGSPSPVADSRFLAAKAELESVFTGIIDVDIETYGVEGEAWEAEKPETESLSHFTLELADEWERKVFGKLNIVALNRRRENVEVSQLEGRLCENAWNGGFRSTVFEAGVLESSETNGNCDIRDPSSVGTAEIIGSEAVSTEKEMLREKSAQVTEPISMISAEGFPGFPEATLCKAFSLARRRGVCNSWRESFGAS